MSIPVEVPRLAEALSAYGPGYLLTTTDGRVKAVTVEPTVVDGTLVATGPGRGTCANIGANPVVTLVFPPTAERGFSLLIDGSAEVVGEDVRVTAESAVLHRPKAHSDGPPAPAGFGGPTTGCGDDCHPVA